MRILKVPSAKASTTKKLNVSEDQTKKVDSVFKGFITMETWKQKFDSVIFASGLSADQIHSIANTYACDCDLSFSRVPVCSNDLNAEVNRLTAMVQKSLQELFVDDHDHAEYLVERRSHTAHVIFLIEKEGGKLDPVEEDKPDYSALEDSGLGDEEIKFQIKLQQVFTDVNALEHNLSELKLLANMSGNLQEETVILRIKEALTGFSFSCIGMLKD